MDALAALQVGFAPALASALLHSLWQCTLLAGAAWLALAALSRSSAALRHTVAMGFLLAMVAAPASTLLCFWTLPAARINTGWLPVISAPQADAVGGFVQQSSHVAALVTLFWLAGVGVMLLRRFGGLRMVRSLEERPCERLPAEWQQRMDAMRRALGIGRTVVVHLSADVVGPFTARLFRPVIWLPVSLLTQLPREQVEALLAHELAHVARMDWLWNGLQCVVEALLFFHPAAWWLGRRIRAEREHACDDLAVAACGDAIALAEALEQLERRRPASPHLVLAAHGGSLMKRIARLLSDPPTRGRWGARTGLVVLIAAGALLVSQIGISGQGRPGIRITSTTDGVLRTGDSREIVDVGVAGKRVYRSSIDAQGRLVETYTVDGNVRPIDGGVRRWVAEVARLSVPPPPPPPPAPPAPPAPPSLDAPPAPPAPTAPPPITDDAMFQRLLQLTATDRTVVAKLGSPVVLASNDVGGRIDIGGGTRPDDAADVRMRLSGPKGRMDVLVDARLDRGEWSIDTINFEGVSS
ncbi:M56 family metallopeptidase [Luteimonas sp. A501]